MEISSVLALLNHMSADEYRELLNDDDKFESFFRDAKQIKEWEDEKELIIASNRSLAEFNLSKEGDLIEAKQKIIDKSTQGEELCKSIQQKLEEYKSKCGGVSLDTTLALLEASTAQSEEASENTAQKFLDGEIDIDKFLEEFTTERITMHLRKVKIDKMTELMRNKNNPQPPLFSTTQPVPVSYPGSVYPGYINPLPYPQRPMNMPMPGMYGNHF